MSSAHRFEEIKALRKRSSVRKQAIAEYLEAHGDIIKRVAARADVDVSMVSKVLHGHAKSKNVERALLAEESRNIAEVA